MSGAADRLRQQTAAIASRDAATAEAIEVARRPARPPIAARTEPYRVSVDLPPDDYSALLRWILEAAVSTGRGDLTRQEVLYFAVKALQDETVARRVRGLLVSGEPAPLTRPKRRRPGDPEVRTSGDTEIRRNGSTEMPR